MLTEAEAKTKWCPMVRFHGAPNGEIFGVYANKPVANGGDGQANEASPLCIGSACMMWRAEHQEAKRAYGAVQPSDGNAWRNTYRSDDPLSNEWTMVLEPRGYCGLAGRPQP